MIRPARRMPRADGKVDQVIRGPGKFIDDATGKVLFTAGEDGKESVTIVPAKNPSQNAIAKFKAERLARARPAMRTPGYLTGGDLTVDPNAKVTGDDPRFDAAYGVGNNGVTPTPQPYGAAGTAQFNATGGVLDATGRDISANRDVIAAGQAVDAAREQEQTAKQNALLSANQYIDTQSSDNAQARAEEIARQAAESNSADKLAVAEAQRVRDNGDTLYATFGLAKPIDVTLPANAQPISGPGVRTAYQTQEQLVTAANKNASTLRSFNSEDSRIAAARANQAAQAAGLNVDHQLIAQDRLKLGASSADLDVRAANLTLDRAKQPPAPGLVMDPYSGDFVTKADFDKALYEHNVRYDPVNRVYASDQDMRERTDPAGNVLRLSDNVWVDPQTKNELINGVWTDPATKNVYDPQSRSWNSPTGNERFVVVNTQTGSGYWVNSQGFRLEGDGVWRNPVTGAQIIDGVVYTPQQLSQYRSTASGTGTGRGRGGGASSGPTVTPSSSFGGSPPASSRPSTTNPAAPSPSSGSALSNTEKRLQLPGLSSFIP